MRSAKLFSWCANFLTYILRCQHQTALAHHNTPMAAHHSPRRLSTPVFFFIYFFCVAFKFGRRVRFALRRKMRKPPITRVSAIYVDFLNRPSWRTDSIYREIAKWPSTRPWGTSIQNSNGENACSGQLLFVSECSSASRVIRCLKVGTYLSNIGPPHLIT